MKKLWCSLLAMVVISLAAPARSDDDSIAKELSKIAERGPGVYAIKKDDKGRIISFMVVGQARISTVLGKPKGLQLARDKARLDAAAQLVKWLSEKVSIHQKSEDETILFIEGSEDNDQEALKEAGKAIEKTTTVIESVAQGMIRGLEVLYFEQSEKDKTYTIVLGWDASTAKATEEVKAANEGGPTVKDEPVKPERSKRFLPDKKIEDKKVTSPDAKKFIP